MTGFGPGDCLPRGILREDLTHPPHEACPRDTPVQTTSGHLERYLPSIPVRVSNRPPRKPNRAATGDAPRLLRSQVRHSPPQRCHAQANGCRRGSPYGPKPRTVRGGVCEMLVWKCPPHVPLAPERRAWHTTPVPHHPRRWGIPIGRHEEGLSALLSPRAFPGGRCGRGYRSDGTSESVRGPLKRTTHPPDRGHPPV